MNEFIVEGTPRSLQGSSAGIKEWQATVRGAAVAAISDENRLDYVDVSARILHFCFEWGGTSGDLDNIAKPILDAIAGVVFFNDNQITQLLLRRTDLHRHGVTVIEGATPRWLPVSEKLSRQREAEASCTSPSMRTSITGACHDRSQAKIRRGRARPCSLVRG